MKETTETPIDWNSFECCEMWPELKEILVLSVVRIEDSPIVAPHLETRFEMVRFNFCPSWGAAIPSARVAWKGSTNDS